REPLPGNHRLGPRAERHAGPERPGDDRTGRAGRQQRQRGGAPGRDDRDPARLRDERQGPLHHRLDARLPQQQRLTPGHPAMIRMPRPAPTLVAAFACVLLAGCVAAGDVRPYPALAPVQVVQPAAVAEATPGAIYRAGNNNGGGLSLFADRRARDVGDLLTIHLVESTTAQTNATTQIGKESAIEMGVRSEER